VHRGIAQFMGYGSYSAAVAEVSVSAAGEVKVHRMVLALDCGHAVNPHQIAAQVEGSVAYGLSAHVLRRDVGGEGRMVELNFHNYPILRLAEMPKVETVIVPSHDFWGAVGEPTICVVAPSVLNAIHAATGKPVREPAAEEPQARLGGRSDVEDRADQEVAARAEQHEQGNEREHEHDAERPRRADRAPGLVHPRAEQADVSLVRFEPGIEEVTGDRNDADQPFHKHVERHAQQHASRAHRGGTPATRCSSTGRRR
jgi:hypothetical protein